MENEDTEGNDETSSGIGKTIGGFHWHNLIVSAGIGAHGRPEIA